MDANLDTLATALYVTADDLLKSRPDLVPWRPKVGMKPLVSDAELVTLAVLSAVLGFDEEARWSATPGRICGTCSPTFPSRPGTTSGCAGCAW